ncbi:snRNA-activating protein complex subunit 3-like [Acanthaster planci]|uniref:snRNA-activating protein complex subunit 3 n=1 Tax=Acanthaster planci TaxID=133434 RepID=A0A8B7ZGK9_ACAPL|nr:snRNA-activating protein complex subunit 3-like [Acanthaster planci]XP_022104737.1 snRNA-activating protein complex subunit 3-like [Acanthaster planci]XP_022104739.1 snRNA-activating protein complex subunit 3-like [Acanthaster planci]XP_022104740.1 snRNA-activating protein complex subunit 3-like [Acanthaster planci]XP_022104741.1 snRNA-activating protein complex subunit 3-like [Acanthaster planci]
MGDQAGPSERYMDEPGFTVSPLLHVGDFLKECEKVLGSEEAMLPARIPKSNWEMAEMIGTEEEVVDELEKVCSVEMLHCPAEDDCPLNEGSLGTPQGIPAGVEHLKTLQLRHKKYRKVEKRFRRTDVHLECYSAYIDQEEEVCVKKPMTILSVTLFRASQSIHHLKNVYRPTFIDRELLVLADQKLTALRDKIICAADMSVASGEYSQVPDAPQDVKQQDVYKSSYFLIEDTFYNDRRDPLSRDLSQVVTDWMKPKKTTYSKSMDDVTFNDLDIRLGYPYLYCHVGNCQHIMVFTDLRLLTNTDIQDLSKYPVLIHKPYWKRILCTCCNIYTAKWKTVGDSFSSIDPSFFCEKCFRMLHYDKEGNKLGSFTAYPFVDPSIFS